jgi:hypothetical protein
MALTTLDPPPSSLEPDAPPPWPEPTGKFVEPVLPQESTGCGLIASALIPAAFTFFTAIEGKYALTKFAAVVMVVLLLLGWFMLRRAKAAQPAHRERFARSRRCWARIKSSTVREERVNRGVLSHYVLDLDLELWETTGGETPHRSSATSTPIRAEAKIPAALGPHAVPGAFFAVLFDPVERHAIPFTLLTKDGAQFAIQ